MSETAWICPKCGQWGRDEFGVHSLPERDISDEETCDTAPVHVVTGPFLRRARAEVARLVSSR